MDNPLKKLLFIGILVFFVALVSTPSVSASEWNDTLNTGLISCFAFNETSGTNAEESVNGLYNGTMLNTITLSSSGKIGYGLLFDGNTNVYANMDLYSMNAQVYNRTDDKISFSFWYKWNSSGNDYANANVFTTRTSVSSAEELFLLRLTQDDSYSGKSVIDIRNETGSYHTLVSTNAQETATWKHYVFTFNDTSIIFYINNVYEGSELFYGSFYKSPNPLLVGGAVMGTNMGEDQGYFDELAFWNRSLSSSEVSQLYNSGTGITYIASSEVNNAPVISLNNPSDASTNQELSIELNVSVTDGDNEAMNVTFYNETWSQLYQELSVSNGSIVNYTWSELNYDTTYIWNVNVTDGQNTTTEQYNFTTKKSLSLTLNSPANASTVNALTTLLNFTIYDEQDKSINYTIYNETFSILQENTNQSNGTTITYDWSGFAYDTEYTWYVNLTNGVDTTLFEYSFTTYADTFAPNINSQYPETATTDLDVTMRVVTDEISTCRWASTSGTAFGSMTNNFSTSNNLTHTYSLSGLEYGMYTYYVRCQDALANNMTSDYNLTFEATFEKSSGTSAGVTPLFILEEEETNETITEEEEIKEEKKNNSFIIITSSLIIGLGVISLIFISSYKKPKNRYGFNFGYK